MISSVYNYYMSQYGSNKTQSKYETHKKSELKDIYKNIVNSNNKAPFYKIDLSDEAQKFAIDVKESALALTSALDEMSDDGSGFKKSAYSSNTNVLEAKFIGSSSSSYPDIDIEVENLAEPQINTGTYLNPKGKALAPGHYTFDVDIANVTYEFQYSVNNSDTNIDIQNKLTRLINNSNIGISASLSKDAIGNNALTIQSVATGITDDNSPVIFTIDDDSFSSGSGSVKALGLNQTTNYPKNASFTVNGEPRSSISNTFTLGKAYDITLKSTTSEPVTLGLKADTDSVIDNIKSIINGYNSMIDLSKSSTKGTGVEKLYKDFSSIAKAYNSLLTSNGLDISDDGSINVDDKKLKDLGDSGSISEIIDNFKSFKHDLQNQAESVVIDPLNYANKVIVAYKNPNVVVNNPYATSAYSGMMFNGYM